MSVGKRDLDVKLSPHSKGGGEEVPNVPKWGKNTPAELHPHDSLSSKTREKDSMQGTMRVGTGVYTRERNSERGEGREWGVYIEACMHAILRSRRRKRLVGRV